jgi:hypothetical protein
MTPKPSPNPVAGAVLLALLAALAGCQGADAPGSSRSADAEIDSTALILRDVPPLARLARGGGQPRTDGYWVRWSTCGEDSRAEMAAANGGAEAGWFLVDDLLENPGITLGDWAVTSCEEAVATLQGDSSDPVSRLARQLLAAELNRAARSGTCAAAGEAIVSGQALLAALGYGGPGAAHGELKPEAAESMARVGALLGLYNDARLCRSAESGAGLGAPLTVDTLR